MIVFPISVGSLIAALALLMSSLLPTRVLAVPAAAACTSQIGPGIPPPVAARAKLPGFHASWYGQSGYMQLCPGERATATLAYLNSGSFGWVAGRMGEVAYLGTWASEPGQDQPSILGGDGARGSPATGWPRYNRIAAQPAPYVGPGQVAWFQFTVQAPTTPGTYRLYVRPLVEGATWLEDIGVFWQVTVLGADGSAPIPTPLDPAGVRFQIDDGVSARDIALVHQGLQHVAAYLDANAGGARRTASTVQVYIGDGTQQYCCLTAGDVYEIVTSHRAWASPTAAAADTWTADGLIPQANMDTFTKRQLRAAANKATLSSLETSWPSDANPFAVSYLAVDRLLAANGLFGIREYCARVGRGQEWHAAFASAFGESTDSFYARFERFRATYAG